MAVFLQACAITKSGSRVIASKSAIITRDVSISATVDKITFLSKLQDSSRFVRPVQCS